MVTPCRRTGPRSRASALASALVLLLLAAGGGACAARAGVPRPFPGAAIPPGAGERAPDEGESPRARGEPSPPPDALVADLARIVSTASSFRGVPYRNGGSDPSGFDCSGFVQYVFGQHGFALPREVRDQFGLGRGVDGDAVKPGDLLFFETVRRGASHVGVAIGADQFVHAPSSRGVVRVERFSAPYWARRFVGARRVAGASDAGGGGLPGSVRTAK